MKSIHLLAALALPLAACGSTSKSSVQPEMNEPVVEVHEGAAYSQPRSIDPLARIDAGCDADARSLGLFQQFGMKGTCIAAASMESLPEVAGALVSQDKAALISMCDADTPAAFVMSRGTWLEVIATGTETMQFGDQELEVELLTCEILDAPENRHVGHTVTLPIGWIQGRIVTE